ncbi:hypothetical protein Tco_1363665 [Tanacetum coccineum]
MVGRMKIQGGVGCRRTSFDGFLVEEVGVKHVVVAKDLKGPMTNYPRLRHEYHEVVFGGEEVLEVQASLEGQTLALVEKQHELVLETHLEMKK